MNYFAALSILQNQASLETEPEKLSADLFREFNRLLSDEISYMKSENVEPSSKKFFFGFDESESPPILRDKELLFPAKESIRILLELLGSEIPASDTKFLSEKFFKLLASK
jgi:hypothetical protein